MYRILNNAYFRIFFSLVVTLLVAVLSGSADAEEECELKRGPTATVARILSGTGLELGSGEKVRLVGVDTTTSAEKPAKDTAGQSRDLLQSLLKDEQVELAFGGLRRDRYGRYLAHVYLLRNGERLWVQRILVERGLARVSSFADNRACVRHLQEFEKEAREAGKGLWGGSNFKVQNALEPRSLMKAIYSFQVVEGVVRKVADVKGRLFLNFDEDWRRDFTVAIEKRDRKRFAGSSIDLEQLAGRRIRVRGWIERWNGPVIKATHPEQIEIVPTASSVLTGASTLARKKTAEPLEVRRLNVEKPN